MRDGTPPSRAVILGAMTDPAADAPTNAERRAPRLRATRTLSVQLASRAAPAWAGAG